MHYTTDRNLALELGEENDSIRGYFFFIFTFHFLVDDCPILPCCSERLSELRLVSAALQSAPEPFLTPGVGVSLVSLANPPGSATDRYVSSAAERQEATSGQQGELALWKSVYINDPVRIITMRYSNFPKRLPPGHAE